MNNLVRRSAVLYARVSSKEQEQEGFSIPAQLKLLKEYAAKEGFEIVREFVDVETAKQAGRTAFGEMVGFLKESPSIWSWPLAEFTLSAAKCSGFFWNCAPPVHEKLQVVL